MLNSGYLLYESSLETLKLFKGSRLLYEICFSPDFIYILSVSLYGVTFRGDIFYQTIPVLTINEHSVQSKTIKSSLVQLQQLSVKCNQLMNEHTAINKQLKQINIAAILRSHPNIIAPTYRISANNISTDLFLTVVLEDMKKEMFYNKSWCIMICLCANASNIILQTFSCPLTVTNNNAVIMF